MENGPMQRAVLKKEPAELCKILKFENLVQSGGEAKTVIAEGLVRVNGQVETRKRRKVYHGDTIAFAGATIEVVIAGKDGGDRPAEEEPLPPPTMSISPTGQEEP
jgi:ribosome-associated protein